MRGLTLIGGLSRLLLTLFTADADEGDLLEYAYLCALNCRGIVCEVPTCEVFAWGNCTAETTQQCADECCTGPVLPPVVLK